MSQIQSLLTDIFIRNVYFTILTVFVKFSVADISGVSKFASEPFVSSFQFLDQKNPEN